MTIIIDSQDTRSGTAGASPGESSGSSTPDMDARKQAILQEKQRKREENERRQRENAEKKREAQAKSEEQP